jgi:hypothetical protein
VGRCTRGTSHGPFEALSAWIDRFTDFVGTKHGLAEALHSADPAYAGLPRTLLESLEPALAGLLDRGVASGAIRRGVTTREILVAVALLCQPVPGEVSEFNERMVGCSWHRPAPEAHRRKKQTLKIARNFSVKYRREPPPHGHCAP